LHNLFVLRALWGTENCHRDKDSLHDLSVSLVFGGYQKIVSREWAGFYGDRLDIDPDNGYYNHQLNQGKSHAVSHTVIHRVPPSLGIH
jgi:lysophospholipase L1-like esterase